MSKKENEILDEIEEILEKNEDARKGYEKAAENADSSALSSYFREKASSRKSFNTELRRELKTAYPDYQEGSFSGTLHRAWMDVKNLFSANDDEAMLEESITGDKAAIEEYDDVIEYDNLAPGLRDLLISQRNKIREDVSKNASLEDLH